MHNYEELLTQAIGRRVDQETIERFKEHGLADRGQQISSHQSRGANLKALRELQKKAKAKPK